jgi:putative phosphoribosyl transferase
MMDKIPNRTIAGKMLAQKLSKYKNHSNTIVLALPRGGVPVGYEISQALHIPLNDSMIAIFFINPYSDYKNKHKNNM